MDARLRFWRWFRAIPLTMVLVVGLVSGAVSLAPGALVRSLFLQVEHRDEILASSARHGVDPLLVCSVIKCESGWDEAAVSGAGAVGLMQVMPSTAETLAALGYVDAMSYDPGYLADAATNIEYGCACLQYLQDYLETTDQVIAAYNAGLGTVLEWTSGEVPSLSDAITYPETRLYLLRVTESYNAYQRFYDAELQPL